ncbi:hypothetical protein METBIDRAFT_229062 [Metschnikowia bicuspidata var. bicuspidata NRRL YB-4993]|uniref:tRNA ligase kinase domain-containing protein n=1 Tax=Metschnikowia bicuspidata var. bicuspidata NRRL YB-4993 TaxID=869754 RepID=A0A1A0HCF6_9ASCO|nr:hypothetical protein METBIDRAFT_229062 [Metschnikowia bicuspidata var. bicuspidata NRRL YB-4993]OBA21794.1 hypothetical protein METBIDRAFT_229062 [Metschnikowia bicuspidata var. bicuspidata NRRL YB-4993]
MTKILFVPISIVGCGKSTVFRTLRLLYPGLVHIENDRSESKAAFYGEIASALSDPSVDAVLLDRNNHLHMHRKDIVENFKGENVTLVALLFVPKGTLAQQMRGHVLGRIALRGDNHPQVKSKSDFGKAKMIVNSFVRNFAPYDAEDPVDGQFDYVVEMDGSRESSEENVRRIVRFCNGVGLPGGVSVPERSAAETRQELLRSLAYKVDE